MRSQSQPSADVKHARTDAEPSAAFFSLVFAGDLRGVKGNPFRTKTPYGLPVRAGFGDAFEEFDAFVERYDALFAAAKALWPANLNHVPDRLADDFVFPVDVTAGELRALRDALAKASPDNSMKDRAELPSLPSLSRVHAEDEATDQQGVQA